MDWPRDFDELVDEQAMLSRASPPPWSPQRGRDATGGCFFCVAKGRAGRGEAAEPAWAGAARCEPGMAPETASVRGVVDAPYRAGLLALREGPWLEAAVRALPHLPEVLLVNATGRDHPRRAGLALHLGAILSVPTVGVTHRPLLGRGDWPALIRGSSAPLFLDDEIVGYWVCTRTGARPLVAHAAWRTCPEVARDVVLSVSGRRARTPRPLRFARRAARQMRGSESLRPRGEGCVETDRES